jgi:hypothetical protein
MIAVTRGADFDPGSRSCEARCISAFVLSRNDVKRSDRHRLVAREAVAGGRAGARRNAILLGY